MHGAWLHDVAIGAVSLLYPPHCLLCGIPLASEPPELVCPPCERGLPANPSPWCATCGGSLAGTGLDVTRCAACRRAPTRISWARSACRYDGGAKACVGQLKFRRQLGVVGLMARRMAAAALAPPALPPVAALVPIPLHPVRQREREFNQAALLAAAVGRTLGRPVAANLLVRRRRTLPQSTLPADRRRGNVAGAFAVPAPARLRGLALLLVDDVVTTGATARACARALASAGAAWIGLLTFAHG